MPIKGVGFPLVRLEVLDVVAMPDGAESPDILGGYDIRVEACNENSMIRDVSVRNVPRAEVVVDPEPEEGRVGTVHATVMSGLATAVVGGRSRRRSGRLDGAGEGLFDGRLEDFDDSSNEVRFAVTFVPGCGDVDVVCG